MANQEQVDNFSDTENKPSSVYLTTLFLGVLAVIIASLYFMAPKLAIALASSGIQLPIITKIMFLISGTLIQNQIISSFVIASITMFGIYFLRANPNNMSKTHQKALILLVAGLVIGAIAIAILLPIYQLTTSI